MIKFEYGKQQNNNADKMPDDLYVAMTNYGRCVINEYRQGVHLAPNEKIESCTTYVRKDVAEQLTFDMVEENQFFISQNGALYQKAGDDRANSIADGVGAPFSVGDVLFREKEPINKILPKVNKISWES